MFFTGIFQLFLLGFVCTMVLCINVLHIKMLRLFLQRKIYTTVN